SATTTSGGRAGSRGGWTPPMRGPRRRQNPKAERLRCDTIRVMSDNQAERLIPLDRGTTESEVVILPDFPAVVDGKPVGVPEVLERTAVVEPAPGEPKVLVSRQRCMVNPAEIRFGYVAARDAARRGREAARRNRAAGSRFRAA